MRARSSVSLLVTTRPDADGDYPRRRVLEHDWESGIRVMEPAQVLGPAPVEVEKEESRLPGPWEEAMRNMQSIKVYQIVAREFVKRYGTSLEPPADVDAAYKLWFDRTPKDDEEVRNDHEVICANIERIISKGVVVTNRSSVYRKPQPQHKEAKSARRTTRYWHTATAEPEARICGASCEAASRTHESHDETSTALFSYWVSEAANEKAVGGTNAATEEYQQQACVLRLRPSPVVPEERQTHPLK
ncbi:hypothetical protein PPROV_001014500 [Pycnococcus provasolii]|uniref:Uncharacterized protein n=1 Tax=Pycnococcus provasolii TaxID=41880 RepID=A0A830I2M1_9CHLO|nr:hypothetical protein PPROV_001014500 [Pycnococcus provasolii]